MVSFKLLSFTIIFLLALNINLKAQSRLVGGFRAGVEIKELLYTESGTLSKQAGFSFGLFGKFRLKKLTKGALHLNVELGYSSIKKYKASQREFGADDQDPSWNGSDYVLVDEKFDFEAFELSVMPTYNFNIIDSLYMEFYCGPFIGFGNKTAYYKHLDSNVFYFHFMDDFGTEWIHMPIGINAGITFYYGHFILDLRYKHSRLGAEYYQVDNDDFFILIGFGF
jgi:hypothetical protein